MSMHAYFVHMFEYETWANDKTLAYVTSGRAPEPVVGIFNHLIADITPWIHLLASRPVPDDLDFSPSWSQDECRRFLKLTMEEITVFVAGLTESDYGRVVTSFTPNGGQFDNTVAEVLTQILSHGQHHRGQIEYVRQLRPGLG